METIDMITSFFKSPTKFFSTVKGDKGYKKPWMYYLAITAVYYAVTYIFQIPSIFIGGAISGGTSSLISPSLNLVLMLVIYIFIFALSLGLVFVSAAIMHLFLMIVGTKKRYQETFKLVCYASTPLLIIAPFNLLSIIPIIGPLILLMVIFAVAVYVMVIEVIGAKVLHDISTARAVVGVVVIPLVLALIIFLIVAAMLIGLIMAVSKSGGLTGLVTGSL